MKTPHFFLWLDLFKREKTFSAPMLEIVKSTVLFSKLDNSEMRYLSSFLYERSYESGELIFKQNDPGFGMYVIIKGSVEISTQTTSENTPIAKLFKGSFFGELSLIDENNVRTATAQASEPTVVIGLFKPDLKEILERNPSIGVKILTSLTQVLGKRLTQTIEHFSSLTNATPTLSPEERYDSPTPL